MAVVGSTITVDLHVTEDADLDSLQGVVRQNERVHPELARTIRQAVEEHASEALHDHDIGVEELEVTVDLVTGRLPGAPRERIAAALDVKGEKEAVASVDDAVSAPERAQIADAVEAVVGTYLADHNLAGGADLIVSVTPIQFR
ncbi:MAG TPA: hypothetical protein VJ884_04825 [Salinibacter sp.]|nr:hypothetical protein [Salinibacter sp.]